MKFASDDTRGASASLSGGAQSTPRPSPAKKAGSAKPFLDPFEAVVAELARRGPVRAVDALHAREAVRLLVLAARLRAEADGRPWQHAESGRVFAHPGFRVADRLVAAAIAWLVALDVLPRPRDAGPRRPSGRRALNAGRPRRNGRQP